MFEVSPKFVFSVFSYHVLWNEQIAFFVKKQIGHKRIIVYFYNSVAFTFNFSDIRTVVESVSAYATQRFWKNQGQYIIAVSEGIGEIYSTPSGMELLLQPLISRLPLIMQLQFSRLLK